VFGAEFQLWAAVKLLTLSSRPKNFSEVLTLKLIDVTVDGVYLIIHTDEGERRQSMNWRGVEQLRAKALSLKGKNVRTTTSGTWDPLRWFATIEEIRPIGVSPVSSTAFATDPNLPKANINPSTLGRENAQDGDQEAAAIPVETAEMTLLELVARAEAGGSDAQFMLAQRYDQGKGINRNLVMAMQWYQRAADQGHKAAVHLLGGAPPNDEFSPTLLAESPGLVTKIYGPPGTGKTHTLLALVQKAIANGTTPDQIGYFSFTNKATEEAKSRMTKVFPQYDVATAFPYFRTLHSLANQCLRTRVNLLSEDQARAFDRDVLIERPLMREGDESSRVVRVKHPILDAASTARAIKQSFVEYLRTMPQSQRWTLNKWLGLKFSGWENTFPEPDIKRFSAYYERFEAYKRSLGAIDYADMLERAVEQSENLPQFELLIVDEAQDLTPVQWDLVKVLISRAKLTYVAGDDDQAICESFGARASEFVGLPSNQADRVLDESWRVPSAVHASLSPLVQKLKDRFPYRKDKQWRPKQSGLAGNIFHLEDEVDLSEAIERMRKAHSNHNFLVMFPTNGTLKKFSDSLRYKSIDHYAANELVGGAASGIRLQTIWGAKGGEADFAALVQSSDMDKKMLHEDPRLEYVAVTRAKEVFYYVGFPGPKKTIVNAPAVIPGSIHPMEIPQTGVSVGSVQKLAARFGRSRPGQA
jgi:hypothetical protein